jgi:hypothetical protein
MAGFRGDIATVYATVMSIPELEPYMTGDDPVVVPIREYQALFNRDTWFELRKFAGIHTTTTNVASAYMMISEYINCPRIAASFDRRLFIRDGNTVLDNDGYGPLFQRIRQLMQHFRQFCTANGFEQDDRKQVGVSRWHIVAQKADAIWGCYLHARPGGPPLAARWTDMDCEVMTFIIDGVIPRLLLSF